MAVAPFKVGSKRLLIPDVAITFMHTPFNPPNYAKFHVPLWFSKLDLRDYLFHVYKIKILNVRSYVKQQRVTQGDPDSPRPQVRRWHRPRAHKHMTVELERPFVWPEEPEDYAAWNRKEVEESEKEQEEARKRMAPDGDTVVNKDRRKTLREQAQALLDGKQTWKPTTSKSLGSRLSR